MKKRNVQIRVLEHFEEVFHLRSLKNGGSPLLAYDMSRAGVEPATCPLGGDRSIHLSYRDPDKIVT